MNQIKIEINDNYQKITINYDMKIRSLNWNFGLLLQKIEHN